MDPDSVRRACELVGWLIVAAGGLVLLTQVVGWNGTTFVATVHALTPYLLLAAVPVAGLACWRHADRLAVAASLVGVGGLILATPVVFAADRPGAVAEATGVRVAAVNLFYENTTVAEAASTLERLDADAILFSEFTPEHRAILVDQPLAAAYPHKVERTGSNAGGMALWSRFPIREGSRPDTVNYTLDITMDGPDGELRLLGVHPPTPITSFDGWTADLATFGRIAAAAEEPTLIIGDFNASFWHPAFRDLLDLGFADAHIAHGRGFSTSWPMNRPLPPFVRLDHAVTGNGLVATHIDDFALPGSDHRGLVVSVAPTS